MSRDLFGFKDEPFSAYPDNKYFFSSILHDKAITLLEYGLNSRKGFMLLTGLKGTGKTMTCSILKDSVKDCNVSMIRYENVSPDTLMQQITKGFGLDFKETDRQELFGRVMEYFVDEYKKGRNNLIIVDDAETISDENLQMLSSFLEIEIEKCKLVQVIISGCPELHDRLKYIGSDLGPKFTFTVELAPLTLRDTTEYVEHRLKTAVGADEVHLFKNNSYSEIYNYSKGIPSEVNRIAHKALSIAKEKKQGRVTPGHIRMAAARLYGVKATRRMRKIPVFTVILLLLLGGAGYYFADRYKVHEIVTSKLDKPAQQAIEERQEAIREKPETPPAEPEMKEEDTQQEVSSVITEEEKPAEVSVPEPEPAVQPEVQVKTESVQPEPEPAQVQPEPEPVRPEPVAVPSVMHGCITAQSGLKIRAGASVDSDLIGTAPYMEYIELVELSADGNWWKTVYSDTEGYMFARYIKVVDSPEECSPQ